MLKTEADVGAVEDARLNTGVDERSSDTSAHLLAQIGFLHREVERLEAQLSLIRNESRLEAKEELKRFESQIAEKNSELGELRELVGRREGNMEMMKRCKQLEKQLAAVISEKNVALMERNDIQTKARRLESLLKDRKKEAVDVKRLAEENVSDRNNTMTRLARAVEALSSERDHLRVSLSKATAKTAIERADVGISWVGPLVLKETQTNAICRLDEECQVNTCSSSGENTHPVGSLAVLLEEKTKECDDLRSRFEDLAAAQRDCLSMLDSVKKKLSDEVEFRRIASEEAERFSSQLRMMQERCSDLTASERRLGERNAVLEEERQQLLAANVSIDCERSSWEVQLQQYEKDLAQLSANRNHANQQLSSLANDNENLRAEVQSLLEREAQLGFSLKAKDNELQELLCAYQNAVRENESITEGQRVLERDMDNLRANLASKEEGFFFLQDQLRVLHGREQQLALDLQSFQFENENLHQKLYRSDNEIASLNAKCVESQQLLQSKDHSVEELHESLAELSKQLVVKENESLLLRRRCDSLQGDVTQLQSSLSSERSQRRILEESNARLVTREILSSSTGVNAESLSEELEQVRSKLSDFVKEKDALEELLQTSEGKLKEVEAKFHHSEKLLGEALESKERLHKIVMEQNKVLAHLSK